jgi:hypothetical protein
MALSPLVIMPAMFIFLYGLMWAFSFVIGRPLPSYVLKVFAIGGVGLGLFATGVVLWKVRKSLAIRLS